MIRSWNKENKLEAKHLYSVQRAAYMVEASLLGVASDVFFPLKETQDEFEKTEDEIFVFFIDERIVGFIALEKINNFILITKLVVDPNHFKKGIAKALVGHCLKLYSAKVFEVGTGASNLPAIQLYQSFQFKIFEEKTVELNLKLISLRRLCFVP